ncbi:MAG TPA: hypothetical protein VEQ61_10655 [Thermoleophilaceae bacterium]|nr:hypothetical protein [Thermoleophilaceae bacterium]
MTFARLRWPDWVALVAALALLLVSAADWYSTASAEEARRAEQRAPSSGQGAEVRSDARALAESQERNAWQEDGAIDRVILLGLLGTVALAIFAAFARAAGRDYSGRLGPSASAGLLAAITALLVAYRILQEPGFDSFTTVQAGAPLALLALGVIALAAARAARAEEQGTAFREPAQAGRPAAGHR